MEQASGQSRLQCVLRISSGIGARIAEASGAVTDRGSVPLVVERTGARALVLGTAQDGGLPQAGCSCPRCRDARAEPSRRRAPACLGLVDAASGRFLIDATPALPAQLDRLLDEPCSAGPELSGVLLTHAHSGHYTGLIHFGREVRAEQALAVHATPRLCAMLERHAPWSELVRQGHVDLRPVEPETTLQLTPSLRATPWRVPHRDELSDTVAWLVEGPTKRLLWLPDVDAWEDWDRRLEDVLDAVDLAFLDATFWSADELPGRDLSAIPHLVHLNHSNPLVEEGSAARRAAEAAGVRVAAEGDAHAL
jgi:pyrroloquinoline quinone biosynthesis protein B